MSQPNRGGPWPYKEDFELRQLAEACDRLLLFLEGEHPKVFQRRTSPMEQDLLSLRSRLDREIKRRLENLMAGLESSHRRKRM